MINIIIDGVEFKTSSGASIALAFDAKQMVDIDKARDAVDLEVEITPDSTNANLFGGEGYLHVAERFNTSVHWGEVCFESVVVFDGYASIRSVRRSGEETIFAIRIRRVGAAWAENSATKLLSKLDVNYQSKLTEANIKRSWSNDDIVKFFPVHRDSYKSSYSSTGSVVDRVMTIDGYHPFINIYKVLMEIFTGAGYKVESDFLESEEFKKLYMSGAYKSQNSTKAKSTMDFYVTKTSDVKAVADYRGRVSMTPYVASNTVGNFVDISSIGEKPECFSLGSCFRIVDGVLTFTPLSPVSVGFEYRFRYITDYAIKSRTELAAFNSFYLESGNEVKVTISNDFVDQRSRTPLANFEYFVLVFGHESSDDGDILYKFLAYEGSQLLTMVDWSTRSQTVVTPSFSNANNVKFYLYVSYDGGGSFAPYGDDWALYQGYVDERGTREVDVTIRTSPETISPTSPKSFGGHYVDGAEMGMEFKLLAGTSLSPYFAAYPGVGSNIEFEDLAQLGVYQDEVVRSVLHLFNLRIYTDHFAGKLYIEPAEEIYDRSKVWDWTSKIVAGSDVLYQDVANELYTTRRWGYQQADGATTRSQEFGYEPGETYPDAPERDPEQVSEFAYSTEFGSWSYELEHYGAIQSSRSMLSPLFSPTLNDTDGLPIVGDRDDEALSDTLEFSPRIVGYLGMQDLGNERVPHCAFHAPERDFTLCFEDRDGVYGLNRYYLDEVVRDRSSQYVTLDLALSPLDISALLSPVDGMASVLSCFVFEIDGEWCLCRVDAVLKYDVGSGVAQVRFVVVG